MATLPRARDIGGATFFDTLSALVRDHLDKNLLDRIINQRDSLLNCTARLSNLVDN